MKKLLIIAFLIPQLAFANFTCKRGQGITKTEKGFLYTKDCHTQVGKVIKENESRKEEIKELRKTIKLKDLAINTQIQRVEMWQTTTFKLEDRIITYRKLDRYENTLWFVLGIVVTGAAVYGAGQLND